MSNTSIQRASAPLVAIIGGGLSGLSLAYTLSQAGIRSHVFDTGKKNVGGRCSSRVLRIAGKPVLVDHSCQAFGGKMDDVKQDETKYGLVDLFKELEDHRIIRRIYHGQDIVDVGWDDNAGIERPSYSGSFLPDFLFTADKNLKGKSFQATGMSGIPYFLAAEASKNGKCEVFVDVWVSKIEYINYVGWRLWLRNSVASGCSLGKHRKFPALRAAHDWYTNERPITYTYVVFAHCGKCATRLAKNIVNLPRLVVGVNRSGRKTKRSVKWDATGGPLNCRFIPGYDMRRVSLLKGKESMKLTPSKDKLDILSQYVLVIQVTDIVLKEQEYDSTARAAPFIYRVNDHSIIKLASNNSVKYNQRSGIDSNEVIQKSDVWTIVSTTEYASLHKAPQEALPQRVVATVSKDMIKAFEDIMKHIDKRIVQIRANYLHIQLWGAALPANKLDDSYKGYLHDRERGIGVVGDWLLGAGVEAALGSGIALGKVLSVHLPSLKYASSKEVQKTNVFDRDRRSGYGFVKI